MTNAAPAELGGAEELRRENEGLILALRRVVNERTEVIRQRDDAYKAVADWRREADAANAALKALKGLKIHD